MAVLNVTPDSFSGDGIADDLQAAIEVSKKGYYVFDGLRITKVHRIMVGIEAHHLTINNCRLINPRGWEPFRLRMVGDEIIFTNNVLQGGGDSLSISGGNRHLIQGTPQ